MAKISNQASVTFSYEGATESVTNNSNVVNSSMKEKYGLSVEKSSTSTCFRAGEVLTYMIRVTNTGCACLEDFKIVDNLGGNNNLNYSTGSARLFMNGTMRTIAPTVLSPLTFEFTDRLKRAEELVLQFSVVVDSNISADISEIVNEVNVTAYSCECECDKANGNSNARTEVSGTATHTITKCEYAEVLITKAVTNDNVCCGDEFDYLITLTNIGSVDATNVVVTDSLPTSFVTSEIHMENNGNHYLFDPSEYTIDTSNLLTLPNASGTAILVPALGPGVDNTTRIRIHGHM